jgi:hypothetical protein
MEEALTITDPDFQSECRDTVSDWISKKQDEIINNMKSPYREKLKKCKWLPTTWSGLSKCCSFLNSVFMFFAAVALKQG